MDSIIEVKDLSTSFGSKKIHDKISLSIKKGEIYGLLGPSGCGKSTLLREMVLLQPYQSGVIKIFSRNTKTLRAREAQALCRKWGVLFQAGALFSSLTLYENIALALREYTDLSEAMIREIVSFKLDIVGLKQKDALLYPSQISGGMKKKAALARALALDAELLFLDEPTSGLDPISAREFDALILKLRASLNLTIVMVSHDLDSIYATLDRCAVIDNKKIVYEGSLDTIHLQQSDFIQRFFKGRDE